MSKFLTLLFPFSSSFQTFQRYRWFRTCKQMTSSPRSRKSRQVHRPRQFSTNRKGLNYLPTIDEWETWKPDELEKQLNPSFWDVEGRNPQEILEKHKLIGKEATEYTRKILKTELDVPYGPNNQTMDVYGTDLDNEAPIFLWVHDGYWQGGSNDVCGQLTMPAYLWGYKTVIFGHTPAPTAAIEEIQEELILCLSKILNKYPKCERIVVGGHSSGCQLALSILSNDCDEALPKLLYSLKGFVLISGVYDLRPIQKSSWNKALKLTEDSAKKLSPLFSTIKRSWREVGVEMVFFESRAESPELRSKARMYYNQTSQFLPVYYWISPYDNHFSIVDNLTLDVSPVSRSFVKYLEYFALRGL